MVRSAWKHTFDLYATELEKFPLNYRGGWVLKNHLNKSMPLHTGLKYHNVIIKKEMIGFKCGRLALTKKKVKPPKKKLKDKGKKKK